eukprot:CAMPEP_0119004420 /NCGR_PEP_ID=MMETSP1176-20130426/1130_1 /TAXON_ID=265551 /ORGANISM="Synedropsis recta cf, Strain CCMP1620" /LENGTH=532 /DNA_ID=CAMNT_0006956119 /DNA_START=115 /DNA_END=1713 /DNA_ORIENTATION=+
MIMKGLLVLTTLIASSTTALQHNFILSQDARTLVAPIGTPYGFLKDGCFGFDVFDFKLEVGHKHKRKWKSKTSMAATQLEVIQNVDAGFLLKRFPSESAFAKYEEEYLTNSSHCIFEAFQHQDEDPIFEDDDTSYSNVGDITTASGEGIFLPIRWANSTWMSSTASIMYKFEAKEAGLYFLMYQVCPKSFKAKHAEIRTTFEIDFHYRNKDAMGMDSYLTAGEMPLPVVFFYFFMSYLICTIIWILNIQGIQRGREGCFASSGARPVVYPIHKLMSVLLVFKTTTVLLESVRYHYIRFTGHAELWSVLYYAMSAVKSVFLFTVVLLIGSGWSFVKPFLTDREKCVIFAVLVMQVLDNIALVVLATQAEGESVYDDWSAVLHMLDILCCCAVLVPIVWQVNALEKNLEDDDDLQEGDEAIAADTVVDDQERADKEKTLAKLKLFRSFYLIVVAYIYFTRIAVYLFATLLDYRHTWFRYFITELATLAFYVVMGLQFRPMTENPYLVLNKKDEDGDEVVFEREMELGSSSSKGK